MSAARRKNPLADSIDNAVNLVGEYLTWRNAAKLTAATSPPTAPGSPAEAVIVERLKRAHDKEMDGKRAAVDALKALPEPMEQAGFDSICVLRLLHFIEGGGGPDRAYGEWIETKVYLQRTAIQVRNAAEHDDSVSVQGLVCEPPTDEHAVIEDAQLAMLTPLVAQHLLLPEDADELEEVAAAIERGVAREDALKRIKALTKWSQRGGPFPLPDAWMGHEGREKARMDLLGWMTSIWQDYLVDDKERAIKKLRDLAGGLRRLCSVEQHDTLMAWYRRERPHLPKPLPAWASGFEKELRRQDAKLEQAPGDAEQAFKEQMREKYGDRADSMTITDLLRAEGVSEDKIRALEEKVSEAQRVARAADEDWREKFNVPLSVESIGMLARAAGVSADRVLEGNLTMREVMPIIDGWLLQLQMERLARNPPPADQQGSEQRQQELSPGTRAIGFLKEHPEWTDKQIAEAVGVYRTTIYKSKDFAEFRKAKELHKQGKRNMPRGRKDKDGNLEAWESEQSRDNE